MDIWQMEYLRSMKVASNRISDIRIYYISQLSDKKYGDEARFYVDSVISHFVDIPRLEIPLYLERRIGESLLLKIHFAVKDLLLNKPLQYVLGETEFCGLKFKVNESVLIPRPETEELVELAAIDGLSFSSSIHILDLGTGSGCIAISLAKKIESTVYAVDISSSALSIATENANSNNVNIKFLALDLLDEKQYDKISNQFDIIISNPPYVREQEKVMMQQNVLDFEPGLALFVDNNSPLIFYKAICDIAHTRMSTKGILWLEINEYLGIETKELVQRYFENVELIADYKENMRFIRASQPI